MPSNETDRTMHYWLALTMKTAREAADVTRSEVAARLRVTEATVARFENCESWPTRGVGIDQYLAAYGALLGVPDARRFWQDALDLWHERGPLQVPRIKVNERPVDRAVDAARQAARRAARKQESRASGAGSPRAPVATPRQAASA
jgi:transcriptional regulator with XRE-family HTH domain